MSTKTIKKCHWPKLNELSLRTQLPNIDINKIQEGFELTKLDAKKQQNFNLEFFEYQYEQCSSISWLVKMETKDLSAVKILSK